MFVSGLLAAPGAVGIHPLQRAFLHWLDDDSILVAWDIALSFGK